MELEQGDDRALGTAQVSPNEETPSRGGPVFFVMKLMGQTAGMAQRAGTRAGKGLIEAGQGAGRFLKVPLPFCSPAEKKADTKQTNGPMSKMSEWEQLVDDTRTLYTRIGERICHLAQVDPAALLVDFQLKALVASAIDGEENIKSLALTSDVADAEESGLHQGDPESEQEEDTYFA